MTALTLSSALPTVHDGLAAYRAAVGKLPLLSADEEQRLAIALRDENDTDAARQLVMGNLRLVLSVAYSYNGYGLSQRDLIQEGNIGLMKAVRKFDVSRGVRLATFATYWIKAEIHEFIIRNWRIVKIATTKAQRKLFFNKSRLQNSGSRDNADIAESLNVKVEEVEEMRRRLHHTETVALSVTDDDESSAAERYLADDTAGECAEEGLEQRFQQQALAEAVESLSERERAVLTARRLADPPQTLKQLAKKYAVSIERVRQIENAAFDKVAERLRRQMTPAGAE